MYNINLFIVASIPFALHIPVAAFLTPISSITTSTFYCSSPSLSLHSSNIILWTRILLGNSTNQLVFISEPRLWIIPVLIPISCYCNLSTDNLHFFFASLFKVLQFLLQIPTSPPPSHPLFPLSLHHFSFLIFFRPPLLLLSKVVFQLGEYSSLPGLLAWVVILQLWA